MHAGSARSVRERTAGPYERNIDCHRRDALVLAAQPERVVPGPERGAERRVVGVELVVRALAGGPGSDGSA